MAQNTMVATELGDALRRLAKAVDGAPALLGAVSFPDSPMTVQLDVRTVGVLEKLAQDLGAEVITDEGLGAFTHAHFDVDAGLVRLRVFSIGRRELRRPADVTESIEAFAERVGVTTFQVGADL